jgi:chromosome segregation ATPase
LEEYRREQLDRIRAKSRGLEEQRKELERLIREHDAKMERLRAVNAEHGRRPTGAEEARQSAPNPMQIHAREVCDVIMKDNVDPPLFPWASQNVIATSMLLRDLPELEDQEGRRKVARLWALLERAAV